MRHDLSPMSPSPQAPHAAPTSVDQLPDPVHAYRALAQTFLAEAPHEDLQQLDKEIAWVLATYDGYPAAAIKHAMHAASLYLARYGGAAHPYVERTVDDALQTNPYGTTPLGWGV